MEASDNILAFEKVLAIGRRLGVPKKPPIFLVTGQVSGVWRGSWQGQEYVVMDRAAEWRLRQQFEVDGGMSMFLGIDIREDDRLVALLLALRDQG